MFDYTFKKTNEAELAFARKATENGWIPNKRGWPDFWCVSQTGEIIFVEVKPRCKNGKMKRLRRDQTEVMRFLVSKGIRCFVSDGSTLEAFDESKHGSTSAKMLSNRWVGR